MGILLRPRQLVDICGGTRWSEGHAGELGEQHGPLQAGHLPGSGEVGRGQVLWVSMPCTKWSSWARLNYHDRPEQLTKFRRRGRKMMRLCPNWLSKTLESGQRPEYYHEWPTHCDGWNVQEMGQIQRILEYFGYRVFWCRIDGCRYNLREAAAAETMDHHDHGRAVLRYVSEQDMCWRS